MDTSVPEDLNSARKPSRRPPRLMVGFGVPTLLLIVLRAVQAQNVKPVAAPEGDAGRGKVIYTRVGCVPCHGNLGGGGSASRLVPLSSAFQAFVKSVRQPSSAQMPALSVTQASDPQLADVFAFLHSVGPSPKADTVATGSTPGNAENGKRLFTAAGCYACHGYVAQGGPAGPTLGPHPIAFPAFVAAVRHPREMPPYTGNVLSDAQLADIYAFVQSVREPPNVDSVPLLK